jgi:preprotein translocase subunit SecE
VFVRKVANDVSAVSSGGFFGKVGDLVRGVPEFIQQVKAETLKVAWPSRRETIVTAIMVVIMAFTLGIFFFAVDTAFSRIVQALLSMLD